MAHEIVQYHNDFNTVPLRGFNEREGSVAKFSDKSILV